MAFSRKICATDKKKLKLNWWEYWIEHCIVSGWNSIYYSFYTWMDLVWFEDNQKQYTLLQNDDPFKECYLTFWSDLGDDDTYPKEFLEYLMGIVDKIDRGEEKLIPLSKDFFDSTY